MLWHILIHCTAKTFHGNRDIFFVNCGHFKADDAIHTIMNTKLGSLALESEQSTLSEKEKIKIVDVLWYKTHEWSMIVRRDCRYVTYIQVNMEGIILCSRKYIS
mgnify:FL=1